MPRYLAITAVLLGAFLIPDAITGGLRLVVLVVGLI